MRVFTYIISASLLAPAYSLAAEKIDFTASIQPILESSCVECHGPDKQKGRLRLDLREHALTTDEENAVISRGKADDSELYRRIILPDDDEERMPYDAAPLTAQQKALIRDWINQGAAWPEGLVLQKAAEDASVAFGLPPPPSPSAEETAALAKLHAASVPVIALAANVRWHAANLSVLSEVQDATLATLGEVASLIYLNLSGTQVTDAGLAHLRPLKQLRRLYLARTHITDAGLAHLRGMTELSYLNVYGTAITDAGLRHLERLTNLRTLYLWETSTTEAGRERLQAALPRLSISVGVTPDLLTVEETAAGPTGTL